MSKLDLVEADCPVEGVDRQLWRNAQRVLDRHVVRLDGTRNEIVATWPGTRPLNERGFD